MGREKKIDRQIVAGVETTGRADEIVEEINARTHIPKRKVVELVFQWVSRQPPAIQNVVLGRIDEGLEETYAKALEDLARSVRKGGLKAIPSVSSLKSAD